ncbi:MAG TPA: hypothetical protein VFV33_10065 [Gemmatimonadaceae bacterium]|nr:hypothetical protein [Gemmatimonadaceae bacterium]
MFIELVDSLRCPSPHEETWLVASVTHLEGRDLVEGVLGCPVCRRQYPVRAGEVDFTAGAGTDAAPRHEAQASARDLERAVGGTARDLERPMSAPARVDEDALLRVRALLALDEGGGVVLLGGGCAAWGPVLEDETQVMPLLLNAASGGEGAGRYPSALRAVDAVPLAAGALRAAWLDAATATPATLAAVVRALRAGGRLVAPAGAPLPPGARELARDAREWVAECAGAASAPVPLRRR